MSGVGKGERFKIELTLICIPRAPIRSRRRSEILYLVLLQSFALIITSPSLLIESDIYQVGPLNPPKKE
jgi:hypothetical protein